MARHDNYRPPEEAKSPRERLSVHRVLLDGGEDDVSIGRGTWDGKQSLLIRWNGASDHKNGFPAKFDNMTWMVVPLWMQKSVLQALAEKIGSDISADVSDVPPGGEI